MNAAVTTPEQRIVELRHTGVRDAVDHVLAGRPDVALARVLVSVQAQARLAGCGVVDLINTPDTPPDVAA